VREATGVTRVREWRDGVRAGGLFVQFVGSFKAEEEFHGWGNVIRTYALVVTMQILSR
jgi:hypothetical protein